LRSAAQAQKEVVETSCVLGCELNPRHEVEWLSEVSRVKELSRDRRRMVETDERMMGLLLESRAPLVLRKMPPSLGLLDRNARRPARRTPSKGLLFRAQGDNLGANRVSDSADNPLSSHADGRADRGAMDACAKPSPRTAPIGSTSHVLASTP
jgi:hypothetical protein